MTDWKALCAELTHEVEQYADDRGDLMPECADRARAALAEPDGPAVPEGREPASVVGEPSDEDIDAWITECADATRYGPLQHYWAFDVGFDDVRDIARAVLARFGNHFPDVTKMVGHAEEEAGELASLIREAVRAWVAWEEGAVMLNNMTAVQLTRAADLLEQLSSGWVVPIVEQFAPVPVPVSERLPGQEDCDAEGRCWWWYPPVPEQNYGYWIYEDNAVPERSRLEWPDSWLPAHDLPLPKGEVK